MPFDPRATACAPELEQRRLNGALNLGLVRNSGPNTEIGYTPADSEPQYNGECSAWRQIIRRSYRKMRRLHSLPFWPFGAIALYYDIDVWLLLWRERNAGLCSETLAVGQRGAHCTPSPQAPQATFFGCV